MTARVGETTFGGYKLVRLFPPFPSSRALNAVIGGTGGSGFKPSWYTTGSEAGDDPKRLVRVDRDLGFPGRIRLPLTTALRQSMYESEFDTPHMIVTYTALITLAILRGDFTRLDRQGLVMFLKSNQKEDGRFVTTSFEVRRAD